MLTIQRNPDVWLVEWPRCHAVSASRAAAAAALNTYCASCHCCPAISEQNQSGWRKRLRPLGSPVAEVPLELALSRKGSRSNELAAKRSQACFFIAKAVLTSQLGRSHRGIPAPTGEASWSRIAVVARATQRRNSRSGGKLGNREKTVRPWFTDYLFQIKPYQRPRDREQWRRLL